MQEPDCNSHLQDDARERSEPASRTGEDRGIADPPSAVGGESANAKEGSRSRCAAREVRSSANAGSARGESSESATAEGGASGEPTESSAEPAALAQHEDNSSELSSAASERGYGYTRRQRTRRQRWKLLETTWKESSVDRCRACRRWRADRSKGYEVRVDEYETEDGTTEKAYVGNIQTCRSSWGCPVCAAKIRQKRAEQIAKAAARHLEAGGGLEFVMLTMPHDRGDDLEGLLDALKEGWDGISKGYARRKDWDEYGIQHYVRSLDMTWSPRNGWHPHYHVLVFTEDPLDRQDQRDIEQRWYRRWAQGVTEAGPYREPNREGVRFRSIESEAEARSVGVYSAEGVMEGTKEVEVEPDRMGMGWEMTRHDLKDEAGYTPWDILEQLDAVRRRLNKLNRQLDDAGGVSALADRLGWGQSPEKVRARLDALHADYEKWGQLWREYEQATKGRRSIQPSRDLWSAYEVEEGDLEDEELADEEQGGEVVATLDAHTMEWVRRVDGGFASLLEAAEDGTYIKRSPDGRIEMTGDKARRAGAPAIGLSGFLAAVRRDYEVWKRG